MAMLTNMTMVEWPSENHNPTHEHTWHQAKSGVRTASNGELVKTDQMPCSIIYSRYMICVKSMSETKCLMSQ